jgi:hypothetical protein
VSDRWVLDAGAFIALDRSDRRMWGRFEIARRTRTTLVTHGGIVAQVFRGNARQARLTMALAAVAVVPVDDTLGRAAGRLLARSATSDAIDAALVAIARDDDRILTSDPDDLAQLLEAAKIRAEIVVV